MATARQIKATQNLVENGGNVSKAMRDAGYSKKTAKTPKKLTESSGFQQILEEAGITDFELAKVLHDGLGATRVISLGANDTATQPDYAVRHKYLETGLKLKGHTQENTKPTVFVFPIYGGQSVRSNEE